MADSIHDLFDADASDRNLPSPYMEKSFAKFEGSQIAIMTILAYKYVLYNYKSMANDLTV